MEKREIKYFLKKGNVNLFYGLGILFLIIGIMLFYSVSVSAGSSFFGILGGKSVQDAPGNFTGVDCGRLSGNYSGCFSQGSNCTWSFNNGTYVSDYSCRLNISNYNLSTYVPTMDWWMTGGQNITYLQLTSNSLANAGCCKPVMQQGGSGGGSGGAMGCGALDANKTGCETSSFGCAWASNDRNQDPYCWIGTLTRARERNPLATNDDIGCCQTRGCWSFSGTQSAFKNCTAALGGGICVLGGSTGENCFAKSCSEVAISSKCYQLSSLGKPCVWNGTVCSESLGGGYSFYNNNSDSCLTIGGWFTANGSCVMPFMAGGGGGSGGGGFNMFAQEARCWFADNRQPICGNVTGCVYCSDATTQINNASSACYNAAVGFCKGHEPVYSNFNGTATLNVTDINQSSMTCDNLRTQQICNCGPLPNCKWSNSNNCTAGFKDASDMNMCQPPVQFCEDPLAKNNYTLCAELASNYMMPCKWENSTTPALNCTFNMNAVFGSSGGGGGIIDYNLISSESTCVAGGGTWRSAYYEDTDGSTKSDSWCEKGALFSTTSGTASANKGNCDVDCWACEFQANGTTWVDEANASAACKGSAKGICQWKSDNRSAPNRQGYCDYPKELMYGGAKDCNLDCKACEFMGMTQGEATAACSGSPVGCTWTNDTNAPNGKGGYCMASSKKSCSTDCFSCYEQSTCSNATLGQHPSFNCSWDSSMKLCKPSGFSGEVCFNGIDDNNNNLIDCGDSACTYDQFCGGGSIGSGSSDCKRINNNNTCENTRSPGGKNCTWITPTWGGGGMSYCDYPGSSCWMYESNANGCTTDKGCGWRNATTTPPYTGRCDINKSATSACFSPTSNFNATNCEANSQCQWMNDSMMGFGGGRCEFRLFSSCHNINIEGSCTGNCTWKNFGFGGGGSCEPICFRQDMNNATNCENVTMTSGLCSYQRNACEPEGFNFNSGAPGGGAGFGGGGSGCGQFGGNRTGCVSQNMTCMWKTFQQGNTTSDAGACIPKGEGMMMEGMDMSPPKILGMDGTDGNIPSEIDIRQYGVKDSTDSLSFGIMVRNITNAALCNGYPIGMGMGGMGQMPTSGNGNATTKFYWYLDTNKNTTDGCRAIINSTSNETGYEFLIKYAVSLSSGSVSESKFFYMCSGGSWVLTNVPLTSNRQMLCGMSMPIPEGGIIGGAMIMVDKENLESFSNYNKSVPIKVRVSSANATYDETNPQDSPIAAGYYTSGTADFKFVDCANPSNKNDEKCKHFNKFGFNVFEDCKNGIDDDSDGSADCADMKCTFMPVCASAGQAFNFAADANDHETPSVMFSQVDSAYDGANIKFDSNEPSNGTVEFYGNDSSCNTVNATISDLGDPSATFDDYKPYHMVSLDSNTLPTGLVSGTMYYYKTSLCDPSGNCAASACQNLTTQTTVKPFVFQMKLPPGFNVTIKGGGNWSYSGNFTKNISAGVVRDVGLKINATVGRNMNVTVNCGNQSLTFVGVDLMKPKSIDMSGAFVCDTNSTSNTLGMNSSSKAWNQAVSDLGLGGSNDYIKLQFPISYSSDNNITWCNDELSNCTRVNNYANCSSGGTSKTDCRIPTSLGFSVYQVAVVTAAAPSSSPAASSGSGGGGGGAATTNKTNATKQNATTSAPQTGTGADRPSGKEEKKGGAPSETPGAGAETGTEKGKARKIITMALFVLVLAFILGIVIWYYFSMKKIPFDFRKRVRVIRPVFGF